MIPYLFFYARGLGRHEVEAQRRPQPDSPALPWWRIRGRRPQSVTEEMQAWKRLGNALRAWDIVCSSPCGWQSQRYPCEHRHDRLSTRLLPALALVAHADYAGVCVELGRTRTLAHAELDADRR